MKRNGLRFLSLYSTTLLGVTGEDPVLLYWVLVQMREVLNAGVPIIVAHMVLLKKINKKNQKSKDLIFSEYVYFN